MQHSITTKYSSMFWQNTPRDRLALVLSLSLAYLLVLVVFNLIWIRYPQFLYLYRDGEYNLWISLKYALWARPFDLTSINPLQGMTTMLVAINPYFNPAQWLFFSSLPPVIKIFGSYSIYALEVMLSTLALGVTLGFSRLHSFVASLWAGFLLFPPFNYFFGLGGWFSVGAMYAHALALSNLCLIVCLKLGVRFAPDQAKFYVIRRNLLLVTALILLILAILFAAVFYNAGMLVGTALLLACVTLSSATREQFHWRIVAGFAILAVLYVLGLPEFYSGTKAYMARFSETAPLMSLHWSDPKSWLKQANNDSFWNLLCGWGMHCAAFPTWPISLSTATLNLSIITGGIAAGLTMQRTTARLGLWVAAVWLSLICYTILMALGVLATQLSPSFFFLMMYSVCALYSSYLLFMPSRLIMERYQWTLNSLQVSWWALVISLAIATWLVYAFNSVAIQIMKLSPKTSEGQPAAVMEDRHQLTPLVQLLRHELALQPGASFRGSVATIYGSSGGTLRKTLGLSQTAPVGEWQFEAFLEAAGQSGSTHDLLDLWTFDIPTLSEYGQGLSRPLFYYMAKFLSAPKDGLESHFAFPHRTNLDLLRALGVRFVIIDKPLSERGVKLRRRMQAGKSAALFLYELPAPNLGNYSPTRILPINQVDEFKWKLNLNPNRLATEAYIETPFKTKLLPAYNAQMIFQKGGVHVTARSKGTSALLLPLQFSHCYRTIASPGSKVQIMRANLIHTLVLFDKNLDLDLRWGLRWGHSQCRRQDVNDLKRLSL